MKRLVFLPILFVIFYSCNSETKEYENVKNISEAWVVENIFPLYESPVMEKLEKNDKTYRKKI